MYENTDDFEFEEDKVVMKFREDISHDCPDYEYVSLKPDLLEKTDEEWVSYIKVLENLTSQNELKKRQEEERQKLDIKMKQFEELKKELGFNG